MIIRPFEEHTPKISDDSLFASTATVVGNVTIGPETALWYGAVIRAEHGEVTIGRRCNIQDNCVVHVDDENDTHLGDGVTVGHGAILHGCTIGNNCVIGLGSILLGGVEVGDNVMIAAGSLVTPKTKIPSGMMVMGSPAKVVRPLTEAEFEILEGSAEANYDGAKRSCLK